MFGLVALLLSVPSRAFAAPECGAPLERWASACSARTGAGVAIAGCVDGVVVVAASARGQSLRVELRRGASKGFARAGDVAVSPVGEYSDWSKTPEGVRAAFEAVRQCAADAPLTADERVRVAPSHVPTALPRWALIGGAIAWLVFLLACAAGRSIRVRASFADAIAAAFPLAAAIVLRRVSIAPAFFHQNGHGPSWIRLAQCQSSSYGPGYAALFGGAAARFDGEVGVFVEQEILAGLAVIAAYAIARSAALSRKAAAAFALLLALDPLAARLARSESYYGAMASLLLLGVAALMAAGPRARLTDPRAWIGAALAGLAFALAAAVHPVAWLPIVCATLACALRRGPRRRRVVLAAATGSIVTVLVLALALRPALAVLRGDLGEHWSPFFPRGDSAAIALVLVLPLVATIAAPSRMARWIVPALCAFAAVVGDRVVNMLGHGAVGESWSMLFFVTAMASSAALVGASRRAPIPRPGLVGALACAAAAVVHSAVSFRSTTTLPTDALEERAFTATLRGLPSSTSVHLLSQAGFVSTDLPIYSDCGYEGPGLVRHHLGSERPRFAVGDYWFRGSTCATAEGRPECDAIESNLVLEPVRVERLPARPSMPLQMRFDRDEVDCALSRVVEVRSK